MPYGHKRPFTGKLYTKKRSRYASTKKVVGELKFHDFTLTDAVISVSGTITDSINLIANGITDQTRIGRKSVVRALHWNYRIRLPADDDPTNTTDLVTVICYLDKQSNGAAAFPVDILNTDFFMSFNNIENKDRFRILYRKTHVLDSPAGSGLFGFGEKSVYGEFHKQCNIPIEFSGTLGVLSEVRSNNIGLLLLSESGLCAFNSRFRVRFTDS